MKSSKSRRAKRSSGYNPDPNDDKIMREKSDELFRKYPGQYVVVCGGEIFIGRDAAALDREARRKHPGITPHGCPIPRPKDLICVL